MVSSVELRERVDMVNPAELAWREADIFWQEWWGKLKASLPLTQEEIKAKTREQSLRFKGNVEIIIFSRKDIYLMLIEAGYEVWHNAALIKIEKDSFSPQVIHLCSLREEPNPNLRVDIEFNQEGRIKKLTQVFPKGVLVSIYRNENGQFHKEFQRVGKSFAWINNPASIAVAIREMRFDLVAIPNNENSSSS